MTPLGKVIDQLVTHGYKIWHTVVALNDSSPYIIRVRQDVASKAFDCKAEVETGEPSVFAMALKSCA
jgi:hypothetical protein